LLQQFLLLPCKFDACLDISQYALELLAWLTAKKYTSPAASLSTSAGIVAG
jgi:hypothetical protein